MWSGALIGPSWTPTFASSSSSSDGILNAGLPSPRSLLATFQRSAPDGTRSSSGRHVRSQKGDVYSYPLTFFSVCPSRHSHFVIFPRRKYEAARVMWSKSGPLESRGGAALRERLSRLSYKSRQMLQICRGWPCPTVAALIRGPAVVWYSVGKHLFARRALLHLSGVTASACKQGGANCLSPSFLWFRGSANKQSGEFYTPAL